MIRLSLLFSGSVSFDFTTAVVEVDDGKLLQNLRKFPHVQQRVPGDFVRFFTNWPANRTHATASNGISDRQSGNITRGVPQGSHRVSCCAIGFPGVVAAQKSGPL